MSLSFFRELIDTLRVADQRIGEAFKRVVDADGSKTSDRRLKYLILIIAVAIPLVIGLLAPFAVWIFHIIFICFIFFGFTIVLPRLVFDYLGESEPLLTVLRKYFSPLPAGLPVGDDNRLEHVPWGTFLLVVANVVVFLIEVKHPEIVKYLCFYPEEYFSHVSQPFIANFASMFLHAGFEHLAGNMIFLWVFGSTLESRIGWRRFILIYFLTGTLANVLPVTFSGTGSHVIGSSGAISGILGVYALRCFYRQISVGVCMFGEPFLSFMLPLPLSLRVRLNSLFYLSFWFLTQIAFNILNGKYFHSNIAYSAHITGYFSGMALALWWGYIEAGVREMYQSRGNRAWGGQGVEDLEEALSRGTGSAKSFRNLALRCSTLGYSERGRGYFEKALNAFSKTDMAAAADLYGRLSKYYPLLHRPELLFRIAKIYNRRGEYAHAFLTLSRIVDNPGADAQLRETALYFAGTVQAALSNPDGVREQFARFFKEFPGSPLIEKAEMRLERLNKNI